MRLQLCPRTEKHIVLDILVCFIPVVSFVLQHILSVRYDTQSHFYHNYTLVYVDWLFVPFNFVAIRTIDWRRGASLFVISGISLLLCVITHAIWQNYGIDNGHMITRGHVVLPAGWVHLIFSIIESSFMMAFLFVGRTNGTFNSIGTLLALSYFVSEGISGYFIHHAFVPTDAIMVLGGTALFLCYPYVARRLSAKRDSSQPQ